MTTAITEIIIATNGGTSLSRKIGKAYNDKALANKSVESKKWWLLKISKIGLDTFLS